MKLLSILGSGMDGPSNMTINAFRNLRYAETILVLADHVEEFQTFLSEHKFKSFEIINHLYKDGNRDLDIYDNIMSKVLSAFERYNHVAFVVPGHPRLGSTLLQKLERIQDDDFDIEIKVFDGISSFCKMSNYLRIDPLEAGSMILDVNRLLLFDYDLCPQVDLYLYHICSVGTSEVNRSDFTAIRLDLLKEKLLKHYSPEDKIKLLGVSNSKFTFNVDVTCELSNIESLRSRITFATSLFVPAKKPRKYDRSFLELIQE